MRKHRFQYRFRRRGLTSLFGFVLLALGLGGPAPVPVLMAETIAPSQLLLALPAPGDNALRILTPNVLELELDQLKLPDDNVASWNFATGGTQSITLSLTQFTVLVNGTPPSVPPDGFKRRVAYAPLRQRDLRVASYLYLRLAGNVGDNQSVEVRNADGQLWSSALTFKTQADPLRFNPAKIGRASCRERV